jgi:diadenosine tetraphosphate (Ap4A) HIT family hydrolase
MTPSPCPFCAPDPGRVFLQGRTVFALWDGFPVNAGHALIIPYRHVGSWFDATPEEQEEILRTIPLVRERIEASHAPAGYNIGVNVGPRRGRRWITCTSTSSPGTRGTCPTPRGASATSSRPGGTT